MPTNASNLQPPSAQAGLAPKLTYRKASPKEHNVANDSASESEKAAGKKADYTRVEEGAVEGEEKPRLTIKQLREAAQNAVQAQQEDAPQPMSPQPQQKRKSSIFGGLFQVKEPTQVALNQVAAQIKAQHGSTSATKVPNVRAEKMPEYVPKVNSKWDGIPESVKRIEKEKKAREKGRDKRDSFSLSEYSMYQGRERGRGQFNSRNSSSTTGSFGSRGRSSGSYSNSTRAHFYTQSANSSGDLASQQRTDRPPQRAASLHSQAVSNTSDASFPEPSPDFLPPIRLPVSPLGAGESSRSRIQRDLDLPNHPPTGLAPINEPPSPRSQSLGDVDAMPAHSTSSPATPQDTPSFALSLWEDFEAYSRQGGETSTRDKVTLTSSGPGVLGPPVASHSTRKSVASGFCAREARELVVPDDEDNGETPKSDLPLRNMDAGGHSPARQPSADSRKQGLEKRPTSSRARLGLRATVVSKDDVKPWETQETRKSPSRSSKPASEKSESSSRGLPSPRTKLSKSFGLFGKEKEK